MFILKLEGYGRQQFLDVKIEKKNINTFMTVFRLPTQRDI